MQNIQVEIQTLEGDVDERTGVVGSIDQDLHNLKEEYEKYSQTMRQEIIRGLKEIREKYNRKLETLNSKLIQFAESGIKELDEEYNRKLDNHSLLQKECDRRFKAAGSKLLTLEETRGNEVNRLKSNNLEISRKGKGLVYYEGILNYLNEANRDMILVHSGTSRYWQMIDDQRLSMCQSKLFEKGPVCSYLNRYSTPKKTDNSPIPPGHLRKMFSQHIIPTSTIPSTSSVYF